jgi:hypothetical protein
LKMKSILSLAALLLIGAAPAPASRVVAADPLTATIHVADVERFGALMAKTGGKPTALQLQREYLDPGSPGIAIFTPGRIVDANHLAATIAKYPSDYALALNRCLPWVKEASSDLRSIYLGLQGALPKARLPQIYIIMGARNSGGTAQPQAQVLGLEVLCRISPTREAFRKTLRHFFAHETVHSLQQQAGMTVGSDALLAQVLVEGGADFIARLVTGEEPEPERSAWGKAREAELWRQFQADITLTRSLSGDADPARGSVEKQAVARWIGNFSSAPTGWPGELGYWMGMRIWERRYAAAADKRAVLDDILKVRDPRAILASGAYRP